MRLSAYGSGEFRGSHYQLGSSGFIRRVKATPGYFGGTSYVIAWLEYGSAFEDLSDAEFLADISGGLLMETLFGPVFFGGSLGEQGRATAYLAVGRIF